MPSKGFRAEPANTETHTGQCAESERLEYSVLSGTHSSNSQGTYKLTKTMIACIGPAQIQARPDPEREGKSAQTLSPNQETIYKCAKEKLVSSSGVLLGT